MPPRPQDVYNPVPSVSPETRSAPDYLTPQATPEAAGAGIGRALEQAGQRGEQLGAGAISVATQYQGFLNQVQTDQAFNNHQDAVRKILYGDPNNPQQPGYYSLKGEQAIAAYPATLKQLEDSRTDTMAGLQNNRQRLEFDVASRKLNSYEMTRLGSHYAEQVRTFATATADAGEKNALQSISANWNDEQAWNDNFSQVTRSAVRKVHAAGGSLEQQDAEINAAQSRAVAARVTAWGVSDPVGAQRFLDSHQKLLEPGQYAVLSQHLRPRVIDLEASEAMDRRWRGQPPDGRASAAPTPEANALLDTIAKGESGGAYNVRYNGTPTGDTFSDFSKHPGIAEKITSGPFIGQTSDAAGRYQILGSTHAPLARKLGITDFSPASQDREAWDLASTTYARKTDGRDLQSDLKAGRTDLIPGALKGVWPSIGSDFTGALNQNLAAAQNPSGPGSGGAPAAFAPRAPDISAMVTDLENDPSLSPEVRERAISKVTTRYHHFMEAGATQRAQLRSSIGDGVAALSDGRDYPYDADQIRAMFPPEQAEAYINHLDEAKEQGQALTSVRGMSFPEVDAKHAQLVADLGRPDITDYARRKGFLSSFEKAATKHYEALGADPVAYLANNPAVAPYAARIDPKDPQTFQDYATASLALQERMGLPPALRHVMSVEQARGAAQSLLNAPDPLASMKQSEQEAGAMWPKVFGDMVTLGKLPPAFQAIGIMDDPKDAGLLARYIREGKDKTASDLLGAKPVSDIKASVRSDPGVKRLMDSFQKGGAGRDQVDGLQGAIDDLAFAKAFYNRDPNAAQGAIDAFVSHYEFGLPGGPRVPTKVYETVRGNADEALRALTTEDLMNPEGRGVPLQEPVPRMAEDYLRMVKAAPTWINAPDGQGVSLMDWQGRFVLGRDGRRVTVPFSVPPIPSSISRQQRERGNIGSMETLP